MATTKLWSVKSKVDNVANYDINPLKTAYDEEVMPRGVPVADITVEPSGGLLVSGINCDPQTAVDEFMEVKRSFGKESGVLAYHGYISFPNIDGLDPVEVLSVAKEVAAEMWGDQFQVILSVHTNTETLHCHFLVNSVSFVDGHKAVNNEKNYYRFKQIADNVCKKYCLTVPVPGTRKPLDYELLKKTLVDIRMKSPDIPTLQENLDKAGIFYSGKNYVRIRSGIYSGEPEKKDGRFVRLSQIDLELEGLFDYSKSPSGGNKTAAGIGVTPDVKKEKEIDKPLGRI